MNNYIISASQGGLSNRIKCLMSSMKMAEKTGRHLLVYWPKDAACNCNFSDLFENKFNEISKADLKKIIEKEKIQICKEKKKRLNQSKRFLIIDDSQLVWFSPEKTHLRYSKISEKAKKEISKYLSILKIKKSILENANKFVKKLPKNFVGIHMRGGDFKTLKSGLGKVSTPEKFIECIEKELDENPSAMIFLSCEDEDIKKILREKFNKKIIVYPKKSKKREDEGSVVEAFIDQIILSKSKKIIGTFGSTFTEMAWFFGSCKQDVVLAIDKEGLKEYLNYIKKQKGVTQKIKEIIYKLIHKNNFFEVKVK